LLTRKCPRVIGAIVPSTKAYFVNRIGRSILWMLPIAAFAIIWNVLGGR